jgi:methylated-DNA-[protein]-cysteine S-methyltransferase
MTVAMMIVPSPLGSLRVLAREGELVGVYLPAQPAPDAGARAEPVLELAARQLAEYFAGERREFALPLAPAGTAFQHEVWRALRAIRYGDTRSYGDLAREIGRPHAMRAVGAANGKNPLAIVVPCHRVIGASGALTGYAGGVAAKRWLLQHEAATASRSPRPGQEIRPV